jgi:glutaredoxin
MQDKKIIIVSLALVALISGTYFFTTKMGSASAGQLEAMKVKAEKFINEKMVEAGTNATVKSIVEEGGMYKIFVSVGSQELSAYISKDGKNFFPQAVSMEEEASQNVEQVAVPKTDKPSVELFVMSYCPYGLQAEKGILPVLKLLGSKIDFQLKFVDYAMHSDPEINENLRQYCIQKNAPSKLSAYLECFTSQGDAKACLVSAKIDSSSLTGCISQTDSQFKITAKAADKNQWEASYPPFDINKEDVVKYGVQGSPVLVINGATVKSSRDPQSLLSSICSGFNNQPSECQQALSGDTPVAGFGDGTGASTSSSCAN